MTDSAFRVALGTRTYRVDRPWGDIRVPGKITDAAIDGRGRIAVLLRSDPYTEPMGNPVQLLWPDGSDAGGFGAGHILDAHKIAADPQGRLWIVDRDSHDIVCFDLDGKPAARLGERHGPGRPFNAPSDIAFGTDGTIVVADGYANGRVHVYGPDLKHRVSFGEVGVGPGEFMTVHGAWVTPDDTIVIADRENHRLQFFSLRGELLNIVTGFHRPSDIWGDSEGWIYVSDGVPTLTRLSRDGRRSGRCRPVLNGAHGLCGAPDGTIYLAEGTPSRVTRLTPLP